MLHDLLQNGASAIHIPPPDRCALLVKRDRVAGTDAEGPRQQFARAIVIAIVLEQHRQPQVRFEVVGFCASSFSNAARAVISRWPSAPGRGTSGDPEDRGSVPRLW